MQSKTSCFNGAVFRRTLARCWPLWAGAALILFFLMPYTIASIDTRSLYVSVRAEITEAVLEATQMIPPAAFLFGLVFAAGTFSFLFSKRATGLMASLPLRREALFCTSFLAGLTMLFSAGLLTAALAVVLTLTKGVHEFAAVWTWLGVYAAETVTFYGIGVFCAMLTGHILVLIPLYALVNLGGAVLSGLLQFMARMLLPGVPAEGTLAAFAWLDRLSPLEQLLQRADLTYTEDAAAITATAFSGWPVVLVYLAVGVVLSVLALLLFRRRSMECAQEPVTAKWLGQLLKIIVTFFCALGLPSFLALFFGDRFAGSTLGLLALTAVGAAIGYLISEMILHKSVRVTKRSWLGVAATALVACLIVGAMQLDVFGYVHRVPEPSEVKSAELRGWNHLKVELTDPDDLQALTELHRGLIDQQIPTPYGSRAVEITYRLNNGRTLTRAYDAYDFYGDPSTDALSAQLRSLLSGTEVFDAYRDPYHDLSEAEFESAEVSWTEPSLGDTGPYTGAFISRPLPEKAAMSLWENGILPDLEAGVFPPVGLESDVEAFPASPEIWITVRWEQEGEQQLHYFVTADSTNTLAWLASHGYEIPGV